MSFIISTKSRASYITNKVKTTSLAISKGTYSDK